MKFENSLNTSRKIIHSIIYRYENHPSICKIKSEVSSKSFFHSDFCHNILVTSDEVEKMLESSKPLSIAMCNSITSSTFPDRAKGATAVPIDKKIDNKYTVSNFRSVNLLNCFSKI